MNAFRNSTLPGWLQMGQCVVRGNSLPPSTPASDKIAQGSSVMSTHSLSVSQALTLVGRHDLVKVAASQTSYVFKDKDTTLISFIKAAVSDPDKLPMCRDYARFRGMLPQCEQILMKLGQPIAPGEVCDEDYALITTEKGHKHYKLAAYDEASTQHAAQALYDQRTVIPLSWRKTAAVNLINKAAKFDVKFPEYLDNYLHKAAGLGVSNPEAVNRICQDRLAYIHEKKASDAADFMTLLDKMAEDENLYMNPVFIKSAMEAIGRFDELLGLNAVYRTITMPEDLISTPTNQIEKLAGYNPVVRLVNGAEVTISSLTKEALAAVNENLSHLEHDDLARILPTLPLEDANILTRCLV